MTGYQSPLLTARVPYDWEELKRAAEEFKEQGGFSPDDGLVRLEPVPNHAVKAPAAPVAAASKAAPVSAPAPAPAPAPAKPEPSAKPADEAAPFTEEELIARIVPKVIERLDSQIEIIVDVTLGTAASRIRADLAKAVENTVRATVRSELAQSRKRPDAS